MLKILLDTAEATGNVDQSGLLMSFVGMLLFVAVFYFLLWRPQRKRDKELKEQVSKMSIGDKIVTIGGITGTLANMTEDEVTIYSSVANTPISFQKAAIQTIIPRNSEKTAKTESKSKKSKKNSEE